MEDRSIETRVGKVSTPAFWPVVMGDGRGMDRMLIAYLPRLGVSGFMMSMYYAQRADLKALPMDLPLFIDSGGFALLARDGSVEASGVGTWDIVLPSQCEDEEDARLTAHKVLDFQETKADVAATLDAPIPPKATKNEREHRLRATIENAQWAADNRRRRDLFMFGCVQGWDVGSYRECAEAIDATSLDGVGIGGIVSRLKKPDEVGAIVSAVRSVTSKPIHVFGVGHPDWVARLRDLGVESMDSSSPMRAGLDGNVWGVGKISEPSRMEQLHASILNVTSATGAGLPLGALARARTSLIALSRRFDPVRSSSRGPSGAM